MNFNDLWLAVDGSTMVQFLVRILSRLTVTNAV